MRTQTVTQTNNLTTRQSKRVFLRSFNFAGTNTCIVPDFFPSLNQNRGFRRIFIKIISIVFHRNLSSGSRAEGINPKRGTDGRTGRR